MFAYHIVALQPVVDLETAAVVAAVVAAVAAAVAAAADSEKLLIIR